MKATTQDEASKLLARPAGLKELNTRAKLVIELEGALKIKSGGDETAKPKEVEARATSTLDYYEKIAFKNSELVASARRYHEASSQNWIAGRAASQKLRSECAETLMMKHDGSWQQFCPNQNLDLRESQLVRSPINTALLEMLLPAEPAKPNTNWNFEPAVVAELFNLEAVHRTTLSAKIAQVEGAIATMELAGEIEGTANSVPTSIKIQGNFRAQSSKQCVLVTWLGLSMVEDRDISQAEPGFKVTARVRVIRTATDDEMSISADKLRSLAAQEEPGRWLVRIQSPAGRFSLLADRKWRTYYDSAEETVLRMIENDMVIAQCNISRLPALDKGSQWTMEGMQADIRKKLGERFEQFIESKESLTTGKLRLLQCVVSGSTEEIPIQWIYNQLSDDSGRRMAIVFTMGGNMTDRFAAADEQMLASLEWLPAPDEADQQPTPAPEPKASPVDRSAQTPTDRR